jgi:hypothetical protein
MAGLSMAGLPAALPKSTDIPWRQNPIIRRPKSGNVLIVLRLLIWHIRIQSILIAGQAKKFHVPRGVMVILQFTMGCIMGIYLLEILTGHWVPKQILAKLKTDDSYPEGRKGDRRKNHFGDPAG